MSTAVEVTGLGKTFRPPGTVGDLLRGRWHDRSVVALRDVSFSVAAGELVCVMGSNGAGKSTLLRILGGLLAPTSGRAVVAGVDVATGGARLRQRAAYVIGDERSFDYALTGRQNLCYFAALHGMAVLEARARAAVLLERVGLTASADRRFSQYSRGMRQRLALARGLLGQPSVLLLDEPTLGLDPVGARDMRTLLREEVLAGGGRAAVVASNDPAEARALGDRVLFLSEGSLTGESAPAGVEAALGLAT